MGTLGRLKPGERGTIAKIAAEGHLKRRLMDMGLHVGEEISIKRVAPLGDPIEIVVKDYNLSLRKREADLIEVIVDNNNQEGVLDV